MQNTYFFRAYRNKILLTVCWCTRQVSHKFIAATSSFQFSSILLPANEPSPILFIVVGHFSSSRTLERGAKCIFNVISWLSHVLVIYFFTLLMSLLGQKHHWEHSESHPNLLYLPPHLSHTVSSWLFDLNLWYPRKADFICLSGSQDPWLSQLGFLSCGSSTHFNPPGSPTHHPFHMHA